MESTVKQRLISYLEYKNLSKRQFCLSCGLSENYINSMRKSIQPDKISNIAVVYPDLNTGWLLTGEGEMLRATELKRKQEPAKEVTQIGSDKIIIDKEVWEVMKAQAESLKAKDEQLSKVISMLEEQMSQKKKVAAQEGNVKCVGAAG